MIKRTLSLLLSVIMIFSAFGFCFGANAADDTMSLLASLVEKYPTGKYWNHMGGTNNPDAVTDTPCASHRGCSWAENACSCNSFDRSIQCMGYAHKVAFDITGYSPRSYFTKSTRLDVSKLRVGDIIRFRSDGHSICVTGVKGSKISFTDCNWDYKCGIRWGVMDISYITSRGFTYVLHLEGNNRTNTDLEFYDHIEDYKSDEKEEEIQSETWQMSNSSLNVRSTASVSGTKVGSIPANATFTVTEKKYTSDYLWGYVTYGAIKGWAALNYSTYKGGVYAKPQITDAQSEYTSSNLTFNWQKTDGADFYLFRLYDSDKKVISQKNVYGNTISVNVDKDGTYYAKVFARSSHASSWIISGDPISFSVKAENAQKTNIVIPASLSVKYGESGALEAECTPSYSGKLNWYTSDSSIVTVENGTVTAVSCGKATVYCKSADGSISNSCTVTVKPENVTDIGQRVAETKADSITIGWTEIDYADGYEIHRYNAEKKVYEKVGTSETAIFTDISLSPSNAYYYLIRAYVDTDSGRIVGDNSKIRLVTKPDKVTGVKQTASSTGTVTLSWNEVENATAYIVYRYNPTVRKFENVKVSYTNSAVLNHAAGESFYYRVYAGTKTLWGYVLSATADNVLTTAGPQAPAVTAQSDSEGSVTLSWESVANATHYYVYRYTSSGYVRVAVLRKDSTGFVDTELESGNSYYYLVRALTLRGGVIGYSLWSEKAVAKAK